MTEFQRPSNSTQVGRGGYGSDRGWPMKEKHEGIVMPRCFYAFVDFEPNPPVTYIVPSATVADVLKKSHAAWLSKRCTGPRPSR